MSQYSDYFLLAGLALCLISVIYAVVQLIRLQPPRAAAITLVLGIVLIFAGAVTAPQTFTLQDIRGVWGRVSEQVGEDAAAPAEKAAEPVGN